MFSPSERLLVAIHNGEYDEVLHCIKSGFFATTIFNNGRTAIGTAAAIGDIEILELLIQSCEEPNLDIFQRSYSNVGDEMDITPEGMDKLEWEDEFSNSTDSTLFNDDDDDESIEHISLYIYYAKTFERTGAIIHSISEPGRLVSQDPHSVDALLMTPLHYAAGYGHLACTRILLAHGARVDAVNSDGCSALHLAVEFVDIVRTLLDSGANPNIKTITTGESVLHIAIKAHYSIVAKILIQCGGANINATDDNEQTPLICAIANNMNDIALTLLDHGARVNLLDRDEKSAIYYAILKNNVLLVPRLLQHGARICTSYYAVHHCVRSNMRVMVELLVATNTDCLSVRNKEGITPIMMAILSKKLDILEYFLKVNATVLSHTELLMAVQHIDTLVEFKPIVRLLLAYSNQDYISAPARLDSNFDHFACCLPYCQMPLTRAIVLKKLDIAAFLLKEGIDTQQICSYHVLKSLRTLPSGTSEFVKLMVHAGYKYPNQLLNCGNSKSEWSDGERQLDSIMRDLFDRPLPLQSLTRLTIRRHLVTSLANSICLRQNYSATCQASSLSRMIQELEIPNTLRIYLADFDDCPMMMQ